MDLGAGPWRTFLQVTLPQIFPGVLAAALLVFALSIDDYVITSFVAGVGTTTLPVQIYSMVRRGITPEINAVSTLLLVATSLLLLRRPPAGAGGPHADGGAARRCSASAILAAPFALGRGHGEGERTLEPLHLVELHRPRDGQEVRGAPRRAGQPRPLRHQRGPARQGPAGNVALRRALSLELHRRDPGCEQGLLRPSTTPRCRTSGTSTRASRTATTTPATATRSPTSGARRASATGGARRERWTRGPPCGTRASRGGC